MYLFIVTKPYQLSRTLPENYTHAYFTQIITYM